MIVTTSARHGQGLSASHQSVDAIVPFVRQSFVLFAVVLIIDRSQCKQPRSRSMTIRLGCAHLIARDLKSQELIVRHVLVEGLHDPVSVDKSLRIHSCFERMSLIFGESSQVEPVTSPPFTVMRRLQ